MATAMASGGAPSVVETVPNEPTLHMKLQLPAPPKGMAGGMGSINNKMRNRLRLDPTRALEPARKKIATIEAQRVMSVFEETISKTETVSMIPYLLQNLDRFRISLGAELAGMLEHHRVIQESYLEIKQTLDGQMRQLRKLRQKQVRPATGSSYASGASEGSRYSDQEGPAQQTETEETAEGQADVERDLGTFDETEEYDGSQRSLSRQSSVLSNATDVTLDSTTERTMRNLSLVAQQLSTSCKNIMRHFELNRAAMRTIAGQSSLPPANKELIRYLNELKEILLHKLLTTPEEESERMDYIKEVSKRERNNAAVIEKLEDELRAAIGDKDEEV